MNENINLCEILKGLEGTELYTDHFNWGKCIFLYIDRYLNTIVVKVSNYNGTFYFEFNKYGIRHEFNGSISHLFPSKEQRDWSKFERPIKSGTPMMCRLASNIWVLRYYAGIIDGKHKVFKEDGTIAEGYQNGMVPFDKFNPLNIEESLKYNIQK